MKDWIEDRAKELIEFKSLDEKTVAKIAMGMPKINKRANVLGDDYSQDTWKLMSLNTITQSPYRNLKECLDRIERKRIVIRKNMFELRRQQVKLQRLLKEKEEKEDTVVSSTILTLDLEELDIGIEELEFNIADTNVCIEDALKEIGMYQQAYDEIKEHYSIPDNYDENSFERYEVEEHIKTAFLHAVRDVGMTGMLSVETHKYLEQYGVNPTVAYSLVKKYIHKIERRCKTGHDTDVYPNINVLYRFLDSIYALFKDGYKRAMIRIGLKDLIPKDLSHLKKVDVGPMDDGDIGALI
jgi:hypothetical protein